MAWLGAKTRIGERGDESNLEQIVADWADRQELTGWIPSAVILGVLLASILLFAFSRLA